ncbi:MAG TPA: CusA/CzcA family heavy metal efflux RND transporter, partial [Alphaproteobacteria bacterium]|nr:CusA/CzcA family heavy metal efflux RND transporter [Alphaproteobacteria bacterium]
RGVSEVASIGGMVRQYQVVVDPDRLRALSIPLSDVRRAIERGNRESGGRVLEMAEAEYMVRASGYLTGEDDIRAIPVSMAENGVPILLSDIATVRTGPELRRGVGELNGEGEVAGGVVIMRYGENALATIERVEHRLEQLQASLPEGVEIVVTYNRAGLIERAVETLREKLLEEFLIVALVCAVFLFHLRSSLVVVLSLPLGILAAFIVMHLQGINANIMSLGGIAIAIGAMVDAAIVMIENFHKHVERTPLTRDNRWRIVADSTAEVGPALFFSLLIITFSFIPIFALEAQEGRLFHPLAFTKTYAMAAAAGLSVTLVPVLMGYLIRGRITPEHANPVNRVLTAGYRPFLGTALRHPGVTLVFSAALVLTMAIPLARLGSEFMPDLDEGDLLYMPSAYPGVSVSEAAEILQQTNRLIMTVPEVLTVHGKAGRADTATDPAPLTMIETTIQLRPRSEWRPGLTMDDIRSELDSIVQVPSLTNVWIMPIRNRIDMLATGIKTPVGIKIAGPDLDVIADLGTQVEDIIAGIPGTASVYAERVTGGRFIDIEVNRSEAARFGMNIEDVHDIVRTAIGGMTITQTVEGRERYPVNLRYPADYRGSLQELRDLPVITPSGAEIPLGRIAGISVSDGPGVIRSENARLNGWVYIDITGVDIGSYVREARAAIERELELPAGYSLRWSGQYEFMQRAQARLSLVVPVTLGVIVLLLFLNFRRMMPVLLILGTLPLALTGGLWFLHVLDYRLSVAAGVGFIALAGVAVEIGVIMLVYLEQALKARRALCVEEGREFTHQDLRQAVIDGALLRIRPVIMTVS